MNFREFLLKEKFFTSDVIQPYGFKEYIEIFKNPTIGEIESAGKETKAVRVGITDNGPKDVYIWDADKALHAYVKRRGLAKFDWALIYNLNSNKIELDDMTDFTTFEATPATKRKKIFAKIKKIFPKVKTVVTLSGKKKYKV